MGDCAPNKVQIKDTTPGQVLISTHSSLACSEIQGGDMIFFLQFADDVESFLDRGCCLNDFLQCSKRKVGICISPAIPYNCKGVWSPYEYVHSPK